MVDQQTLDKLSKERQVIRRKQEMERICVRYAGDAYAGIDSKPLEPNLEDYYMYIWQ